MAQHTSIPLNVFFSDGVHDDAYGPKGKLARGLRPVARGTQQGERQLPERHHAPLDEIEQHTEEGSSVLRDAAFIGGYSAVFCGTSMKHV